MKPSFVVIGKVDLDYYLVLSEAEDGVRRIVAWESVDEALKAFEAPLHTAMNRGWVVGAVLCYNQFQASIIEMPEENLQTTILVGLTDMKAYRIHSNVGINISGLKLNRETAAPYWEKGLKPKLTKC